MLFLATLASTAFVGGVDEAGRTNLLHGLWYAIPILVILTCHEFGHYIACRIHDVDATLPYFLPMPFLPLTGTLGAVIKIKESFPSKKALFDIGVAGPIAGFVALIPFLIYGVAHSTIIHVDPNDGAVWLGEPLLFKAVSWLVFGAIPEGYSINMHPMGFAAWFGLLATALNLFPIGQLDGGHISYAVLGRRSTLVTLTAVVCLVGLSFVSSSWIVWTVLTVGMLLAFGVLQGGTGVRVRFVT